MDTEIGALVAIIDTIRAGWTQPRVAVHPKGECPFPLRSSFVERSGADEASRRFPRGNTQLLAFWGLCASADLFKDERFGQWGVELLDAKEAHIQTAALSDLRPLDCRDGDVVFGRFYGDSELLVMVASGRVLVCLPLNRREDWPEAASSLLEFLSRFHEAQGAKYWEA
ncbi:hypothetical protein [Stenotrophomonas maltophilia]|uniref:hypothetical protein n=1 Tax=Stenotrophomonas maltophilia TaxID=40324 RepID=UPI0039F72882